MWQTPFRDRAEAGRLLAERLKDYAGAANTIVLALPRGGVPVGFEIASALLLPLDVLVVRKLGLPAQPELAMGAIASGGGKYLNKDIVLRGDITLDTLVRVTSREAAELERQERLFRGDRPPVEVTGKTVILVDDGVATGATMIAGVRALRAKAPKSIVVAVPVAPPQTVEALRSVADDVVCVDQPMDYTAVSQAYEDFPQVEDSVVNSLLAKSHTAKVT